MPIYSYGCLGCDTTFTIKHGMNETCEGCPTCGSDDVLRRPTTFNNPAMPSKRSKKVGDATKEYIEDAKQDLKTQKEELEQKR